MLFTTHLSLVSCKRLIGYYCLLTLLVSLFLTDADYADALTFLEPV